MVITMVIYLIGFLPDIRDFFLLSELSELFSSNFLSDFWEICLIPGIFI